MTTQSQQSKHSQQTKDQKGFFLVFNLLALLSLLALKPFAVQAATTLPVEVIGPDGYSDSVSVSVPVGQGPTIDGLWMQVNNLSYPNALVPYAKASVQINGGVWLDLTNTSVNVQGLGQRYGGIGGPFSTLKMTLPLTPGTIVDGNNTITFRFNRTDGVSAGYRVINFNLTSRGRLVLPNPPIPFDDPSTWTVPGPPASAANGQALWQGSKPLLASPINPAPIGARCTDCHAKDGRDLKYFNYSNKSIHARAVFHGLTDQDGDDLAAYIRTLTAYQSTNGRPWNPPYQPGPGLDSRPNSLQEWSAGAGIDAVLENDQELIPYIFPGGNFTKDAIKPSGYHNIREIPMPLQFLDWNHWLPRVHPRDVWSDWGNPPSAPVSAYSQLRSQLQAQGASAGTIQGLLHYWAVWEDAVLGYSAGKQPGIYNNTTSEQIYSLSQWSDVKNWEVMQEFQAEGLGLAAYASLGPGIAEPRTWFVNFPFVTSPHMLHIPRDQNGIIDGNTSHYLADFWYRLQITLYSNRYNVGQNPIDWSYTWGFIADNAKTFLSPTVMQLVMLIVKAGEMTNNTYGPDQSVVGWAPDRVFDPSRLAYPGNYASMWSNTDPTTRKQISEAMLGAWLDKSQQYPIATYYAGKLGSNPIVANPNYIVSGSPDGELGDRIWSMIPIYRGFGVDGGLLGSVLDWAKLLYPKTDWDLIRSGTLTPAIALEGIDPFQPPQTPVTVAVSAYWHPVPNLTNTMCFYVNGIKVAESTLDAVTPGRYVFNWAVTAPGKYTLRAQADMPGGSLQSGEFAINFTGSSGPPPPPPGPGTPVTPTPAFTVRSYPNPWRADKHASVPRITFDALPANVTVKIFTLSGHLIKELHGDNTIPWDLTNTSGDRVASGIYLYLATDGQGNKAKGKVAVIK